MTLVSSTTAKMADLLLRPSLIRSLPIPRPSLPIAFARTFQTYVYSGAFVFIHFQTDLSVLGDRSYSDLTVSVIDPVDDYLEHMKSIFDFDALKRLIALPGFQFVLDAMYGVTGCYVERIFRDELGASSSSCMNTTTEPDFHG